jgi:hypothetical protein
MYFKRADEQTFCRLPIPFGLSVSDEFYEFFYRQMRNYCFRMLLDIFKIQLNGIPEVFLDGCQVLPCCRNIKFQTHGYIFKPALSDYSSIFLFHTDLPVFV